MRVLRVGRLPRLSLDLPCVTDADRSYDSLSRELFSQFIYGANDGWSHHLHAAGAEGWDVVANARCLQRAWWRENVGRRPPRRDLDIVMAQARAYRPTIVFVGDFGFVPPSWLKEVRDAVPTVRALVGWCGAAYRHTRELSAYDLVLTCMPELLPRLSADGVTARHLHHALDARVLDALPAASTPRHGVVFSGQLLQRAGYHTQRAMLVAAVASRVPLEVYTDLPASTVRETIKGWTSDWLLHRKGWGPRSSRDPQRLAGIDIRPALYGLAMYGRFRDAAIVLNTHTDIAVDHASNLRLWEATGLGACLVTEDKDNLPELFGTHGPATYRSIEEAVERIVDLVDNPAEAEAIGRRTQQTTLQNHTYTNRVDQFLELLDGPAGFGGERTGRSSSPATKARPRPRMRIAIDARVHDGEFGGVQQAMLGLAQGLASLGDSGGDEYRFIVWPEHDWLLPALSGPCQPLVVAESDRTWLEGSVVGRVLPQVGKSLAHLWESRARILPEAATVVDLSDFDLVHFMRQRGFRTTLPNIYQPHDLQHIYYPEFFHPLQRVYRHQSYRAMARQADRVAVMTAAARLEIARRLEIGPKRVIVVPWASVLPRRNDEEAVALPPECPERYVLYPAHTWPHKNHEGLLRALAVLRHDHGQDIPVVFTGTRTEQWPRVEKTARALGVDDLVASLGFVAPEVLQALYGHAVALVFPSLYEGWGLPLMEAFTLGTPVCCSDISPLREVAGGAARLFDPHDPADMAKTLTVVWTDEGERRQMAARGRERVELFTWTRTAELFRAHYRDVLGLPLSERDKDLLAAPPLV